MTSPQATTTDSVSAVIATTGIEDNLSLKHTLTAVEQQNPDNAKPNTSAEPEPQDITTSPKANSDSELAAENAGNEQSNMEMYREPEHAAIHENGAAITALIPPDLPAVSMPMAVDGLTGMDALNVLLATAGQTGNYDDFINGMQLAPASVEDMPPPMAMDESMVPPLAYLDPSPYIREHDETRISAYAKLEFDDGEFYMNTYSVILGRDLAAARSALREAEENERRRLEEEASAREPKTPVRIRREESRYSKSVVSESGGILREGDDTPPEERERRRKLRKSNKASKASKKSKSTGSSSHRQSRRNSLAQPNAVATYQAQPQTRRLEPQTAGAAPVDPTSLRPSPHDCPLVGIHPPAAAARDFKSISREHVKIAYNSRKHLFEAEILGRNGAFVDDVYYGHKNVIPLKSGSQLQIGGVVVRFVLPDVAIGETGAENRLDYEDNPISERYSEGGKEMSFDFEDAPRQGLLEDTSDDSSDDGRHGHNGDEPDDGEEVGEEVDEDEEEDIEDRDQSQQLDDGEDQLAERNLQPQPQENPKSQKKRGPGRPPKNGIMSKREQQLAKKEALAQAQAQAQGQGQQKASKTVPQAPGQLPQPVKNKVGRPRKHPLPENPEMPREKRKYTKRKPKEPKAEDVKQEGSGDDRPTEKKDKKAPKPPRSPSPVFNREDYTEEQLAKPQGNYVNLIYEVLSNSTAEGMSLPQIYRALLRKYPYYHTCSTTGWQSSVRHNLGQHEAFKKVQRDGKGWLWAINEGVSIEKEKKRKSPPPPQIPPGHIHHQPIYQAGHPPHMYPGHPYGPGVMGPPGYPMNQPMQQNVHPGHPQYMGPPPHMNGHPYPQGPYLPMNGQHPPPGPVPAIPPQLAPSVGPQQYSSPYAPKPPQSATPQPQQQSNDPRSPQEQKPATPASPPAPTTHEQPQQPQVTQAPSGRPVHNENVLRAVESFKTNLGNGLRAKSSNADAVMDSAVNRVLGFTNQSTVPGDPHEDMIMRALQSMLSKIEGSTIKALSEPSSSIPRSDQRQSQPPQANQNGTQPTASHQHNPQQPSKTTGHEAPSAKPTTTATPTVMRPSFFGQAQNRPNASVPRPPMMTPGIKRTNSGSPATNAAPTRTSGPSSASPVPMIPPTPSSSANGTSSGNGNGASATHANVSVDENGQNGEQMGGQKRSHEDSVDDDMREFKRMSTSSGLLQLKT